MQLRLTEKISLIIGLIVFALMSCSNVDGDLDNNFQKGSFSAICLLKNGKKTTFLGIIL